MNEHALRFDGGIIAMKILLAIADGRSAVTAGIGPESQRLVRILKMTAHIRQMLAVEAGNPHPSDIVLQMHNLLEGAYE